jgi:putative redox protein
MSSPGIAMSARISGLDVTLTHQPSGQQWRSVPPRDNGGDGSSFSPTDMVGAALASCALASMALAAEREGLDWGDASATVIKHMVGPPRRIGELTLHLRMPAGVRLEHRPRLEEVARTCPVARSLHPELCVPLTFEWP